MPENTYKAYTISAINRLPAEQKQEIYTRILPPELLERFNLKAPFITSQGERLFELTCSQGCSDAEMELHHEAGFRDPLLYGHITDTYNGQVHVLLYILNDPTSPRFDVDRMPDGTPTKFGIFCRNLEAEQAAMHFGLGPGQVRKGLRMLGQAIAAFEAFRRQPGERFLLCRPVVLPRRHPLRALWVYIPERAQAHGAPPTRLRRRRRSAGKAGWLHAISQPASRKQHPPALLGNSRRHIGGAFYQRHHVQAYWQVVRS